MQAMANAPAMVLAASVLAAACGGAEVKENVCGDADEGEPAPNNKLPMSQSVAFGKILRGCVDASLDLDFYLFSTPTNAAGGYLTFELANGGEQEIRAILYVAAGEGQFKLINSQAGQTLTGYAAMLGGLTYAIRISHGGASFDKAYPYELELKWNEAADGNEPNDFPGDPKPISAGKIIKAKMFAGYKQTTIPSKALTAPDPVAYDDFFEVNLKDGPVTVQLADVPANLAMRAELTGVDGKELLCAAVCSTAQGMGADFAGEAKAGKYLLKVTRQPAPNLEPAGAGEPPESFTQDYLLKVTQ